MSNYQKMKVSLAKLEEIRSSVPRTLLATKEVYKESVAHIDADMNLSPIGKDNQKKVIKQEVGKGFLKTAKKMKDEYQKATISAKVAAEILLNEKPKKPSTDITVKTFERQFNDLKMKLLLETRPENSLKTVNDFIKAQKDPFFAQTVIDEFPMLTKTILESTAGNQTLRSKVELQKALDEAKRIATTPEQAEALEIYEAMDHEFDRDLFRRGLEMDTITDLMGAEFAKYANAPDRFDFKESDERQKVGTMPKLSEEDESKNVGAKILPESAFDRGHA